MSELVNSVRVENRPSITDNILLRNIQLTLPAAAEAWHRPSKAQPCTAGVRLTYSSTVAAAEEDNVAKSVDYGKLFRKIVKDIGMLETKESWDKVVREGILATDGSMLREKLRGEVGQDVRLAAGIIANCGLQVLDEMVSGLSDIASISAIKNDFAEFEIRLHLPKAILRADCGLNYRSKFSLGSVTGQTTKAPERCLVLVEEEFDIQGIICYPIVGINPWERLERQKVTVGLKFIGPGLQEWSSILVDCYQKMTSVVAERVEQTSFGSIEALASLIARIVTLEFGNSCVTVTVEKKSALAFVEGSGVEITRTREFFQ